MSRVSLHINICYCLIRRNYINTLHCNIARIIELSLGLLCKSVTRRRFPGERLGPFLRAFDWLNRCAGWLLHVLVSSQRVRVDKAVTSPRVRSEHRTSGAVGKPVARRTKLFAVTLLTEELSLVFRAATRL